MRKGQKFGTLITGLTATVSGKGLVEQIRLMARYFRLAHNQTITEPYREQNVSLS